MKALLLVFQLSIVLIASGCTQYSDTGGNGNIGSGNTLSETAEQAKTLCISLCNSRIYQADEKEKGPCLSDTHEAWTFDDWVCDIAHDPRQDVDNEPANQCQAFRSGRASHFIELDTECNFLRAV